MVCIWVAPTDDSLSKGLTGTSSAAILKDLDPESLGESLRKISASIGTMLRDIGPAGDYALERFEVGLEVTAEAGINLVGTAKAGGKAALVLSFAKLPK